MLGLIDMYAPSFCLSIIAIGYIWWQPVVINAFSGETSIDTWLHTDKWLSPIAMVFPYNTHPEKTGLNNFVKFDAYTTYP